MIGGFGPAEIEFAKARELGENWSEGGPLRGVERIARDIEAFEGRCERRKRSEEVNESEQLKRNVWDVKNTQRWQKRKTGEECMESSWSHLVVAHRERVQNRAGWQLFAESNHPPLWRREKKEELLERSSWVRWEMNLRMVARKPKPSSPRLHSRKINETSPGTFVTAVHKAAAPSGPTAFRDKSRKERFGNGEKMGAKASNSFDLMPHKWRDSDCREVR